MIGADEFDDTFLLGGYDDELWPGLAQALSAYLNSGHDRPPGRPVPGLRHAEENENEFAVYNAVECADVNWPRSLAYWTSDTEMVYKTAPF